MRCSLQLCFALVLASLWQVSEAAAINLKEKILSSYRNNATVDDSGELEFVCDWNCEARYRMNLAFIERKILIRLRFSYEKRVDFLCRNDSHELSRFGGDTYWKIWMANNNVLSKFASNALQTFSPFLRPTVSEQMLEPECTLSPNFKSSRSQKRFSKFYPRDYSEKVIRWTVATLGNLCNTETEQSDLQRCIMVSEYHDVEDPSMWADIIFLFTLLFTYYSPAIVCLFSASEVTRQGIRQISVEGPSPVGFRRLIGNCFFSLENTFWHRMRKFIMRVILLPIPFLVPAMYVEYLLFQNALSQPTSIKETTVLFQPFMMVCYGCYFIRAFAFHFIVQISDHTDFCVTNDESFTCSQRELPEIFLNHLRRVCKILIRMWTFSWKFLRNNVKVCIRTCPSFVISLLFFYKFIWFIIRLLAMILSGLLIILLTGCLTVLLLWLSPGSILCHFGTVSDLWKTVNISFLNPRLLLAVRSVIYLLDSFIISLSLIATMFVLRSAAVGIIIFPQFAVAFVLCEENLPFASCCVLVSFYLWSHYRSFTQKYKDLAVKLHDKHDCLARRNADTELNKQWVYPEKGCTIEKMKRIPKELFDLACEEIMPVRETICETLLKAYFSVTFVFLVYSLTMLLFSSHLTITVVIFVAALFPKIFMYLYKRQVDVKYVDIDEKARHILEEYIKSNVSPHINRAGKGLVSSEARKDENDSIPVILRIICYIISMFLFFYYYIKFLLSQYNSV